MTRAAHGQAGVALRWPPPALALWLCACAGHAPDALAVLAHPARPVGALELHLEPQLLHGSPVQVAALSQDGRLAATASEGELLVWAVRSGQQVLALGAPGEPIGLGFDAAGDRLAAVDAAGRLTVWQLPSGHALVNLHTVDGLRDAVLAFDLDAAGRFALLGRAAGSADLWDLGSGQRIRSFGPHESRVTGVALSPDGASVLTGTEKGALRLWDRASGTLTAILRPPAPDRDDQLAEHLSFHPTDPVVLSAVGGRVAEAWHLPTQAEIGWISGPEPERSWVPPSRARALRFAPDGRKVWAWVELHKPDRGLTEHASSVGVLAGWDLDTVGSLPEPDEAFAHALAGFLIEDDNDFAGAISGDGGRALAVYDGQARVWDLGSGALVQSFLVGDSGSGAVAALLPDGQRLLVRSDRGLRVWDLAASRATAVLGADSLSEARALAVCPRGGRAAAAAAAIEVWDLAGARRLAILPAHDVAALAYSPDCARLVSVDAAGELLLWDLATRRRLASAQLPTHEAPRAVSFTEAGAVLVAAAGQLWRWDGKSAGKSAVAAAGVLPAGALALGAGGRLGAASAAGRLTIWDLGSGRTLRSLPSGALAAASFSPDGRRLLGSDRDGTQRLWDLASGDQLDLRVRGDDWVMFSPDGYFDASENGAQLVSIQSHGERYGVQQFALQSNRPDVLLARFGLGTPELLGELRAQVVRRWRKAGVGERSPGGGLEVPTARIVSARARGDRAELAVELADAHGLASYRVLVNGVPEPGGPVAVRGLRAQVTPRPLLSDGVNKIEVSAVNQLGVESLREQTTLVYRPPTPRPADLYVLAFGVSHYRDPRLDLGYAAKDAQDLARTLSQAGGFRHVHIHSLVDREVTVDAIRRAGVLLADAQVNDTVVLFVSGHGVHERTPEARYYFATYEVDPRHLAATAADFELVEALLRGTAARRKLFLLDTCESGDLDPTELAGAVAQAGAKGLTPRTTRALELVDDRPRARTRPAFTDRERFVFRDLSLRSGAVVLSSSRGSELSYESRAIQNGYFTHAVIEALTTSVADSDEDGRISSDELRRFVAAQVASATAGLQHPTVDRDNLDAAISLPRSGR